MDILEFDPSQLDENAAKEIAEQLVALNQSALDRVEHWVAGESVEQVLRNEKEYSKIYRPIIREVTRYVANNHKQLEEIQATLIAKGMSQVHRNKGMLTNLLNSIGERENVVNHNDGSAINVGSTPGAANRLSEPTTTINEPLPIGSSGISTATVVPTVQPVTVLITPTSIPTTEPTITGPIVGSGQATIGQIGYEVAGPKVSVDTTTCRPPIKIGPCGPPGTITTLPSCPAGYRLQYGPGECFWCVDMQCGPVQIIPPITVPPSPTPNPVPSCIDMTGTPCPPGQEWTYTYPPGLVECHPIAVVPPLCPKPIGGCPDGSDWVNDPTTGVWHCVPNGQPIPKPKPITVPDCDSLYQDLRLNVSLACNELPNELQKKMKECGYTCGFNKSTDPIDSEEHGSAELTGISAIIHKLTGWIF